jgi:hypothetical protein
MRKLLIILAVPAFLMSCDQSDGTKSGVLQKVSSKKFPCSYYEIQVAYEGGKIESSANGKSSAYSNTQEFTINKSDFDSLTAHVGDKIIFSYQDRGVKICEPSMIVTSYKFK